MSRSNSLYRLVAGLAAAAVLFAACGGGTGASPGGGAATGGVPTGQIGGSVSVVGSWTGPEQASFEAMIQPWRDRTGVQVNYVGSRDLQAQLTTAIQGGGQGLPDVAGLPGPGLMKEWYDKGALKSLDFVDLNKYRSETPPGFADLGVYKDKLIAVFTKAASKGLIWYNKSVYTDQPPTTFEAVQNSSPAPAANLWCIGFESGAASGWPGTDWIEDIVIRQSGPDVYDKWVRGEQKWTSPEIKSAFTLFGQVVQKTAGGGNGIVSTSFQNGGNGLFANPPTCKFHHQASFMSDFLVNNAKAKAGDFDFFVMPDINSQYAGAITGAGDLFGMFKDTPQARSLIDYLLTAQAQEIWVKRGGFLSANKNVPVSAYPDEANKKSADILQKAKAFRFDGSDLMPGAMTDAFNKAMVSLAQDPSKIDSILQGLDTTQKDAYGQ
jgi:alpha-glucoside transport system substrate-binding protein